MKTALRVAAGLLLSGVFLGFAFRAVDLSAVWHKLAEVDLRYVALYCLCLLVIQFCRVFRFDVLIRPFVQVPTSTLLRVSNLGLMLIFALPFRLGELARPVLLKREAGASLSAGIGASAVERTVDGLVVTLLFFATTFWLSERYPIGPSLMTGAYLSLALFGGATVVILMFLWGGARLERLLHRVGDPISARFTTRVVDMVQAFISGLKALPDWRAVTLLLAYTVAYWAANGLGFFWVGRALGFDLPPIAGFVLVSIVVLGIMIPAGPGHLGTFQAAIGIGLGVFGVGANEAQAYGLVVYPLSAAVMLLCGLPYLFTSRTRVRDLVADAETSPPASRAS